MKHYYFLLAGLFFAHLAVGQIVNIPDPAFKAILLEAGPSNYIALNSSMDQVAIDTNSDGEIQLSEAAAIPWLDLTQSETPSLIINDLTGINAFVNLTNLNCSNHNLTSLNVLSFTKLQRIALQFKRGFIGAILKINKSKLIKFGCQPRQVGLIRKVE